MKLSWGDIGGAAASAPSAPKPVLGEIVEDSPKDIIGKADNWLNQALDMIRKVDEMVGIFLQLSGKGAPEGQLLQAPPDQGQVDQAPAAVPPDQILAILDKILQSEGDIPLSRFIDGIRNQESWLLKYALGANNETRP